MQLHMFTGKGYEHERKGVIKLEQDSYSQFQVAKGGLGEGEQGGGGRLGEV